jgi:Holliday junction resolvasome RuvABC ATP-dependent DNA helicase subunit
MTNKEMAENRIAIEERTKSVLTQLIDEDFAFIDECETIAEYIEESLYDTIAWQLPIGVNHSDENHANEMHEKAMEQVIAILAARCFLQG